MANELGALGALALRAAGGLTGRIEELHSAIARRSFAGAGPGSAPARLIHDGISAGVYSGLRGTSRALAYAAARIEGERPLLSSSLRGELALGALNGFLGDDLERERSALALPMAIRSGGRDVSPCEVAVAFAGAGPAPVVFLHGLCETDRAWWLRPRGQPGLPVRSYGDRLAEECGRTPVYLRYNSGLPITENGGRLAELLEEVADAWPVPIERMSLVGHSMGGLVARRACHHAVERGMAWPRVVRQVVCLGSPHLGAPLAKAARAAAGALERLPETRPIAQIVDVRSQGIKDLCFEVIADDLENAEQYFVGATLTRRHDAPLAGLVGDLLVKYDSASRTGTGKHVGGITHFDLLNHPEVYATLRDWLSEPPSADPAAG